MEGLRGIGRGKKVRGMKKMYLAGVAVFAAFALFLCAASAEYAGSGNRAGFAFVWGSAEPGSERTFAMAGIQKVEIAYGSANVEFLETDGTEFVVREYLYKNHGSVETQLKVEGDTLSIVRENDFSTVFWFGFRNRGVDKVEILLPESYRGAVEVSTGSGNIGADADLVLHTFDASAGSGNIRCRNVEAEDIKVSAGSGNISLDRAEGHRDISTGSGNIRVLGGAGNTLVAAGSGNIALEGVEGKLEGTAGSGNIRAVFGAVTGDISVTTVSGDIKLELPEGSAFSYEGSSVSGIIRTDFDGALDWNKKGNQASGSYGNGGVRLYTKAASGNTTVSIK